MLVIDSDPQGNASTALDIDHSTEVPSIYDVIIDDMDIADTIAYCPEFETLAVVPATIDLAGAEIELVSRVAREQRLSVALDAYLQKREEEGSRVDYVFIDCPPSLGPVSYTHLTLPTIHVECRSRWSPYH